MTKRNGVDPRLLGEAGRGAIRFAQFVGPMDADSSTDHGGQVTMVQLNMPTDGASFADRWSAAPTVDVNAMSTEGGAGHQNALTEAKGHSLETDATANLAPADQPKQPRMVGRWRIA